MISGFKKTFSLFIAMVLLGTTAITTLAVAAAPGDELDNFMLLDHEGKAHELRRLNTKAVVLFFTANGCPVARQAGHKLRSLQEEFAPKGVSFYLINSAMGDDRESIRKERFELGVFTIPVLKDETQGVSRHLGVRRTGEVIAISGSDWKVLYRGALDDQMVEGAQKPEASANYLKDALNEFLSGKPVTRTSSVGRGCLIHYEVDARWADKKVSFEKEVFPILKEKCVNCHSTGNVGSWAMKNYGKVRSMASMIEEVVLTQRMPPWDPDKTIGKFRNDHSLTVVEAQTLLKWIEQGADKDVADDPLEALVVPPAGEWPLGAPDIILKLPELQKVPATGVVDYRRIKVPMENSSNLWVRSFWIKPGNKKVVHHAGGRLVDPKTGRKRMEFLFAWAPGSTQGWRPDESAQFVPTNAVIEMEMHYTTCGTEETDDTEVGVYLAKQEPKSRFDTVMMVNAEFQIPPGESDHQAQAMHGFNQEVTLYGVVPHMHLRGNWMRFDLLLPNGKREALCSVPRYDFNWQQSYVFEKPLKIPAGSWVVMTGGWDNSPRNPANPDPKKIVRWGDQSWEEMFLGTLLLSKEIKKTL